MTAALLLLLAATPSQAEARALAEADAAARSAARRVSPFETDDADPFADMLSAAQVAAREFAARWMIEEFQERMAGLGRP